MIYTVCWLGELFDEVERQESKIIVFGGLDFVARNLWIRDVRYDSSVKKLIVIYCLFEYFLPPGLR